LPRIARSDFFEKVCSYLPVLTIYNKIDLAYPDWKQLLREKAPNVSNREENLSNRHEITGDDSGDQNIWLSDTSFPFSLKLPTYKFSFDMALYLKQKIIENSKSLSLGAHETMSYVIVGIPNVGKSSIINFLRSHFLHRKSSLKCEPFSGTTKSMSNFVLISHDPAIRIIDSPGVLEPNLRRLECRLQLLLCGNMKENLIDKEIVVDYLLFYLNRIQNFKYVQYFGMREPNDDIHSFLCHVASRMGRFTKRKDLHNRYIDYPDTLYAANYFLSCFRKGLLGHIVFGS
ncbi:MAG: Mitochondrial GTPase, partial [Marteilia pararefringens]